MFLPQETIRKKRDGRPLDRAEIAQFIHGVVEGSVGEGQIAAFAMATLLKGMSIEECVSLTLAMRDSGEVLDWRDLPGPVVDKHSTGGVGDLVSLVLGPLVAACGGFVPMISGRGLGHTGGTLDKLESIPGYCVTPSGEVFRQVVRDCGVAIIGQTAALAPADKKIYAVRDITATVESIDLITASILSKKLAAGLQFLVMDVKCGNGAFMTDQASAQILAKRLVEVANGAGMPTTALITDMNQPLARSAGNALEVREAIEFLQGGKTDARLREVVFALSAQMLAVSGLAESLGEALAKLEAALASGRAAEVFAKMVRGLGGPADLLENPDRHLAIAPITRDVKSLVGGFVSRMDSRDLGLAVVALGGGRRRVEDVIDHSVGIEFQVSLGDKIEPGQTLAIIHAADSLRAEAAAKSIASHIHLESNPPQNAPAILETIELKGRAGVPPAIQ
jgi:thymidine phosphorylase